MRAYRDYIFIFNIYVPALLPCMLLCFPGAAIAAFALAVCLLCTSFLRGAALWSMTIKKFTCVLHACSCVVIPVVVRTSLMLLVCRCRPLD